MTEEEIISWLRDHPNEFHETEDGKKIYLITKNGILMTIGPDCNQYDWDILEVYIQKLLNY
jgi:hypothetical protein